MRKPLPSIYAKRLPRLFLQQWMRKVGLDKKRLSERMGVSKGTVTKLLNGNMAMTVEYLARFAHAFDVAVIDLFRDPDAPTQQELLAAGSADELRSAIRLVQLARTGTDN